MTTTFIDILKKALVSKKLTHKNEHGREVSLQVEDVKVQPNERQVTPDSPQNDWNGISYNWDTIEVTFVDGSKKEFKLDEKLNLK